MPTGEMTRWHSDKGFGFVKPDDGSEDLFCHVSSLLDGDGSVQSGDAVSFKIEFDKKKGKDRAVDVAVAGGGGGRRDGGGGRSRSRGGGGGGGRRGRSESPPPKRGGGGGGRGRDDSRDPPPRRGGGGRSGGGKSGTGELLKWNDEKGFGFIKPDNGDQDLFVHASGLADGDGSVQGGDRVSFTVEYDDRKGKDRATNVAREGGGGGGRRSGGGGRQRDRSDSRRR